MAYILGVRGYRRDEWGVAHPDDATRWLVCDEDGDEDTLRGDTVLGVFGSPEAATQWLKDNGGNTDASR